MNFTNFNRNKMMEKVSGEIYDVLIIGGGITGAGIALDAVTRGMKVALIEMQDFAAGTSSRSTKLVHGGLRYLKQLEIKVVAEVGKERAIVYENGPHVTTPEWMLLPIHKGGTFGKWSTSFGLRVYDFLAGVKKNERRSMLNDKETSNREPLLKKQGLIGGGYYVEYRTDDARLTIEVMKKAFEFGADALNYTRADEIYYQNGMASGAVLTDMLSNKTYTVKAHRVINATGPWGDSIREKDHSKKGKQLRLSKGVHLVIDQTRFPLKQAVYFDTADRRMVFAIPRSGKTYVGTTDTFYQDDTAHPQMCENDRNYLIEAINYMFPEVNITHNDVESSWAGVRPLIYEEGKDPSEISRKDEIWTSSTGLITIAGGKLTGYRRMAETVVDLLSEGLSQELNRSYNECRTKIMPISGGDVGGSKHFASYIKSRIIDGQQSGLSEKEAKELAYRYGSNVPVVYEMIKNSSKEAEKYNLPITLFAKLVYGMEHEMIATPVDFFFRRTGDLLFNIDLVKRYKNQVVQLMAQRFAWGEKQILNYQQETEQAIIDAIIPADAPDRQNHIKKLSL